jgi:hypothetical protein
LLTVTTEVLQTVTGSFQYANTARVANGVVSFSRRAYFGASGAQLLTDGTPVVAQLDSNGSFSVQLYTYDSIVKPTPYAMVVYDAQGNFLIERFVYFQGGGTHIFNDVPEQNDGTAFPPQYVETGLRLIQGNFGLSAANGKAIFRIYQQCVTSSGVQIVPSDIVVQLDGSGVLPANYLYLQGGLKPFTVYLVRILGSNGNELSKLMYSLAETAPAICNLTDLSAELIPGIEYSNIPGVFWVAVPWKKP